MNMSRHIPTVRLSMRIRAAALAALLVGAAFATGFSPVQAGGASQATQIYAVPNSPGTNASNVQFTNKTVVISAAVIKTSLTSVSSDGSTYTFSSRTGAVGKLKVGSVMLLTGIAVRDVTSLIKSGNGLVVHTNPAQLTDLLWKGQLNWNTPVNYSTGIVTPASSKESLTRVGAVSDASSNVLGDGGLKLSGELQGYDYSMKFTTEGRNLVVEVELTKKQPISLTATVQGTLNNFLSKGSILVDNSKVESGSASESGLSGNFTLSYEVKPASGLGANGKTYLLSLPGSMRIPIIIDGIPFYVGFKVAYFVGVGFSQKSQKVSGSYTIGYNGSSGFTLSSKGVTTPTGAIKELGKILLSNVNAALNGPIGIVMGAQIPRIEFGLGVKGASAGAYANLVASTEVEVGGSGGTGGCDARKLEVLATTGAEAEVFGLKVGTTPFTLFDRVYNAAYPPGCGVAP